MLVGSLGRLADLEGSGKPPEPLFVAPEKELWCPLNKLKFTTT